MSDWIWLGAMLLFGTQMFILGVGYTWNITEWSRTKKSFWWGLTHPFGPPPSWWPPERREQWLRSAIDEAERRQGGGR